MQYIYCNNELVATPERRCTPRTSAIRTDTLSRWLYMSPSISTRARVPATIILPRTRLVALVMLLVVLLVLVVMLALVVLLLLLTGGWMHFSRVTRTIGCNHVHALVALSAASLTNNSAHALVAIPPPSITIISPTLLLLLLLPCDITTIFSSTRTARIAAYCQVSTNEGPAGPRGGCMRPARSLPTSLTIVIISANLWCTSSPLSF